jgi:hypothetical protein
VDLGSSSMLAEALSCFHGGVESGEASDEELGGALPVRNVAPQPIDATVPGHVTPDNVLEWSFAPVTRDAPPAPLGPVGPRSRGAAAGSSLGGYNSIGPASVAYNPLQIGPPRSRTHGLPAVRTPRRESFEDLPPSMLGLASPMQLPIAMSAQLDSGFESPRGITPAVSISRRTSENVLEEPSPVPPMD